MKISDADILFVAGLGNSGPGHWQRRWQEKMSTGRWVEQENWDNPDPRAWVEALNRDIMMATRPVVIVAHSLGVLTTVLAAQNLTDTKVRGAFLVAAPDPENKKTSKATKSFAPVPTDPLPFPSLLIASITDPYCSVQTAVDYATAWGSDYHASGADGHLDAASGHGPWPEGLMMFTRLMQRLPAA